MLKRLRFLIWPLLVAAIILVARFDKDHGPPGHSYDVKCVQPSEPSSAPASLTCAINSVQNADESETDPHWGYKLIAWPEGITAWLLLFTLIGIFWQAQATAEAAKAARDSAEAARLNAEAIVRSERPWLIAVVEKDPKSLHFYSLKIRNVGRTPARFISGDASYLFAERADHLPLPPKYESPIVLPNQLLIAPTHGFSVPHGYDVSHLLQQPEAPNKTVVIYGRVLYKDTINLEAVHETRWCFGYVYNAGDTSPGFIAQGGFILAGPSEYTDNT